MWVYNMFLKISLCFLKGKKEEEITLSKLRNIVREEKKLVK